MSGTDVATQGDKPKPDHPNVFAPIATLIASVPASLEAGARDGALPRYVRIARLRPFLLQEQPGTVAVKMADAVGYFIKGGAYLAKFGLRLRDILIQVDAGIALADIGLELVKEVGKKEFGEAISEIATATDTPIPSMTWADTLTRGVGDVQRYIGFVPSPEDFDKIAAQLYALLSVRFASEDWKGWSEKDAVIDIRKTGKMRLLTWSLGRPLAPVDRGGAGTDLSVQALGLRPLWMGSWKGGEARPLIAASRGFLKQDGKDDVIELFDGAAAFTAKTDITELNQLLDAHGYFAPGADADAALAEPARRPLKPANTYDAFDDQTRRALALFQKQNGLPVTGEMSDTGTVNQLLHLHWDPVTDTGVLRRAERFPAATGVREFAMPDLPAKPAAPKPAPPA
jgi:hypothetical protein